MLVVFKGRGGDWMYFNAQDDRDKGSVIDWMKNRVSSDRIAGLGPLPGRNLWQSVNDHFRDYLNLPEAQRPRLDLPPIVETAPGEKFHSIYTQHCRPLENTAYLEGCGITKSTIANPQFAGRILNQLYTVQKKGMPAKKNVNTAFPAYHEGRVVGLELKGRRLQGPGPRKPVHPLVVGEQAARGPAGGGARGQRVSPRYIVLRAAAPRRQRPVCLDGRHAHPEQDFQIEAAA